MHCKPQWLLNATEQVFKETDLNAFAKVINDIFTQRLESAMC